MPKIGAQFDFRSPKANFKRDQFDTLAEMKACTINDIDEGHISYCIETKKHYVFNPNNELDELTGYWEEFKSGGSMDPDMEEVISASLNDLNSRIKGHDQTLTYHEQIIQDLRNNPNVGNAGGTSIGGSGSIVYDISEVLDGTVRIDASQPYELSMKLPNGDTIYSHYAYTSFGIRVDCFMHGTDSMFLEYWGQIRDDYDEDEYVPPVIEGTIQNGNLPSYYSSAYANFMRSLIGLGTGAIYYVTALSADNGLVPIHDYPCPCILYELRCTTESRYGGTPPQHVRLTTFVEDAYMNLGDDNETCFELLAICKAILNEGIDLRMMEFDTIDEMYEAEASDFFIFGYCYEDDNRYLYLPGDGWQPLFKKGVDIEISDTEPEDKNVIWVDTSDEDESDDAEVYDLRRKVEQLTLQVNQLTKLLMFGVIAGDSTIGGRTMLAEQATPIKPDSYILPDPETPLEPQGDELIATVPNLACKVDTLQNFIDHYYNLVNGEIIYAKDKNILLIYYNGQFKQIGSTMQGGGDIPGGNTTEPAVQITIGEDGNAEFTNGQTKYMEVDENGVLKVTQISTVDDNAVWKLTSGSISGGGQQGQPSQPQATIEVTSQGNLLINSNGSDDIILEGDSIVINNAFVNSNGNIEINN